jgi:hypothetical protein
MQRWLLEIKDVEAFVVMKAATEHQTPLSEVAIDIDVLQLRKRDFNGKGCIFKVIAAVFLLMKDTKDPFSDLTTKY